MAGATSRWVRYPLSGSTAFLAVQEGIQGLSRGTGNTASDTFTIPGTANNQITVNVDGAGGPAPYEITLTSGTALDPRFVARDMQRKIQLAGAAQNDGFRYCQVDFNNFKSPNGKGQFVFRSGTTGASSSVTITAGTSDARTILGLNTVAAEGGSVNHIDGLSTAVDAAYTGTATVSGVYRGQFDDVYNVVITDTQPVGAASPDGGNLYGVGNAGVATAGGFWNHNANDTYTVTIDTTNGQTVGGGTGNVPTFTVSSSPGGDNIATAQEILYADVYYAIGTRGLKMKWSDAPFKDVGSGNDVFTVVCTEPLTVDGSNATGAVGVGEYVYRSLRGDDSTASTVTSIGGSALGTLGLTISWSNSGVLTPRDEWKVVCKGPTPEAYDVTNMVYGNVTVTTESPVKVHQFEIISGAVDMSSVKFSLQADGNFQHHDAGDTDTFFRFGTAGAGNPGDGVSNPNEGPQWTTDITPADISANKTLGNTGAPIALAASKSNLSVVSSADNAEDIGNTGLVADFCWTNIRLGAQESGANSNINYRLYFDFS